MDIEFSAEILNLSSGTLNSKIWFYKMSLWLSPYLAVTSKPLNIFWNNVPTPNNMCFGSTYGREKLFCKGLKINHFQIKSFFIFLKCNGCNNFVLSRVKNRGGSVLYSFGTQLISITVPFASVYRKPYVISHNFKIWSSYTVQTI